MKFSDKKVFKDAIINHGLAERKVMKFVKDERNRVRAICDWPLCPWVCLLRKTSLAESWLVTSLNDEHTCPKRRDNKLVTARRIADRFESLIRANPAWSLHPLQATVQQEMFANVSISKCKRAKSMVMARWLDKTKGEYSRVYDYQEELLRSNPGSTVVVKLDLEFQEPVFQRMDGNNQIYPIAWAVAEMETNDSWDWFCYLLCKDLQIGDGDGWVVISDQQKGILKAIETWLPRAEHRNCARHIYANWREKFKKKEYQKMLWKCAKAPCMTLFNIARAELAEKTPEGAQAILNTSPHHWSRAWMKLGSNCDSVDNNLCECFNKWIIEARYFPIISMLEAIRCKPAKSNQRPIVTSAEGRVATIPGGTASLRLEANVPSSQATAKVYINITSGTASARVKAQEPSSWKAPSTTTTTVTQDGTGVKQHTKL